MNPCLLSLRQGAIFFINNAFIQIFCNICDSIKFKCDNPFRENAVTLRRGVIPECRAAPPRRQKQRNAFYAV